MPSSLTNFSSNIDINYPEIGKDNDTQGFRNNFRNIQSAFLVASNELTTLIDSGVQLNQDNDFNYHTIEKAVLKNTSFAAATPLSIVSSSSYSTVDFSNGVYHTFTVTYSGSFETYHSFNITNWPANGTYGNLHLHIYPKTSVYTATINVTSTGTVTLLGNNTFPRTYQQTKPVIYEIWSTNNGANVYVIELTSI